MSIGATHDQALTPAAPAGAIIHPLWVRLTHWVNAVAMVVMIASGWEIYNASPLFPFAFPRGITLGGWLAGALLWHFAAMWLLAVNGLVYLVLGIATGRFRRKLVRIEQPCLRPVVEIGNLHQHVFRRRAVDDVAAGEKDERPETRAAAQEQAPRRSRHEFRRILDEELRIDARWVFSNA